MTKPLVFNYNHYETLRDKCNDMALTIEELQAKVNKQAEQIMLLKDENTNLRIRCRIAEADDEQRLSEA